MNPSPATPSSPEHERPRTVLLRRAPWGDHGPDERMSLGRTPIAPDPVGQVERWYAEGVRFVELEEPVDLSDRDGAALSALVAVREATAHGIVVDWHLEGVDDRSWKEVSHLYPPATVDGGEDHPYLGEWRETYRICKFFYRNGPGFVQVRDHRGGALRRFKVSGAPHLRAMERLAAGAPEGAVDPAPVGALEAAGMIGRVGSSLWLLPYRLRRWPLPAVVA